MAQIENPGREAILSRIRAALTKPAASHPAKSGGEIFFPVGDPLDRFQKECTINNTECLLTDSEAASSAAVAEITYGAAGRDQYFCKTRRYCVPTCANFVRRPQRAMVDGRTSAEDLCKLRSHWRTRLSQTPLALIFVTSADGGRGAAVVAPIHIVLAFTDQLVPDLEAAFARLYENGAAQQNSMVVLITGSSRTGRTSEKILVMGAHGPRRLVVALSPRSE